MNSAMSTTTYRSPILSTCDIGKYKYRIVVNCNQENTGMTGGRINVEKCPLDMNDVWENVERDTVEHKAVIQYGLFSKMRSECGL
ncbi:hypothetical protein [Pelosinus sp. IPA-1]|uniref:hypothetical protein n=1 Tax=Pelosinus sp. IPA-1 TaxID=3029569 RepID=UPI0024361FBB|nr:hypothetical protein [Pelosinus sp. IPA-1]GMA98730.1 hypothetical protein PIPA1_15300 [Pelosinus sp. IPA-1]